MCVCVCVCAGYTCVFFVLMRKGVWGGGGGGHAVCMCVKAFLYYVTKHFKVIIYMWLYVCNM